MSCLTVYAHYHPVLGGIRVVQLRGMGPVLLAEILLYLISWDMTFGAGGTVLQLHCQCKEAQD